MAVHAHGLYGLSSERGCDSQRGCDSNTLNSKVYVLSATKRAILLLRLCQMALAPPVTGT